ncbi:MULTISPECIES: hypothetical protein [Glaesserella]|uniref:Uncharacterized protein n=1 Tax=Glaesserella australis TaxID=2094024 RepID=A0A328BY45_9PAST|nr:MULTISPECIES: hypothetical protein [Glaesserella]AUI65852.1 hypothetical protein CJD39_04365 [Glaesserella sp. 15-184]RAL18002.1 hypothetical protein C5N92_10215 [Glaesserella australis]
MKRSILDFIQNRGLQIPLIYSDYEEDVTGYIRFYIPNTKWEFYIYEIDEPCDFANALVYSPHTHGIPDHGLIPLQNFVAEYAEAFSGEVDFSLAIIDETFTPTKLSEIRSNKPALNG